MNRYFFDLTSPRVFHIGDTVKVLGNHSFIHDGEIGTVVEVEQNSTCDNFRWIVVKFDSFKELVPFYAINLENLTQPADLDEDSCSTGTCSWTND